jgi:PTS system nitrogen regulatory IIA component
MNFTSYVKPDGIILLKETTKTEALLRLAAAAADLGRISDKDQLIKDIFYREQLMSTGIGLGIAIPHVRFPEITSPLIVVGIQPAGIPDYASIDDEAVKVIVMILVGTNQHKEHIRLLAQIVAFLKTEKVIPRLLAAPTPVSVYDIIKEAHHE